ncbi:forkhead box protein N4 [Callorhinchus milii]|uniref:Forkhead box N4 n=1 Tax=Callorhinchus milii TaxID=7868 RepID=C7A623_CALMI|nr:forkhead box protein N4 [Callorhinchus milii]ACN53915.1 forkhead box N4 [Callorhinchus milii]
MIENEIRSEMSGILRTEHSSQHPAQEYRPGLVSPDPTQLSEDDLPSDLQSLSWLTSVDVPRLQQMATGRMNFNLGSQNATLTAQTGLVLNMSNMSPAAVQGAMIHVQASMQHGLLGMNSVAQNISQYSVTGQHHTGFQTQPSLYQAHSQQLYSLPPSSQQCSPGNIYSPSYSTQSQYSQPRLAPHSTQDLQPKTYPKPIYSYSCLIAMALKNSKTGSLPVSEIYSFMKEHFPYFKTAPDGWKNSVRHNLSLNKCFEKVENKLSGSSRKGCLWALNPAKIEKMEEEMQKWKRKDLPAIRRSMANPDELDKLISDRPENCRRAPKRSERLGQTGGQVRGTQGGLSGSHLPHQAVATLSLHSLPLHHHHHHLQQQRESRVSPGSPAPAQTPPLHTVPDITCSPLSQHGASGPHSELFCLTTDTSTDVDTLDPTIMDFALHGNLWEEIKDESFNLETLGAFSTSPLRLSESPLGTVGLTPISSSSEHCFPDLQVTGLYTTYASLENVPAQYLNTKGNKPIALQ